MRVTTPRNVVALDARENAEGREEERRWGRVVCLSRGTIQVFVDMNVCLFLLDTSSQGLRLPFVVRFGFPSLIHCPSRSGHLAVRCWVIEMS
jgi:hypothetical protein